MPSGFYKFFPWTLMARRLLLFPSVTEIPRYIMGSDGSNQKRVTFNSTKDYSPCFSPDGNRIAYHSNMDGNSEIYTMNLDGGNHVRLTRNNGGDETPVWIGETIKAPANPETPPVRTLLAGSTVTTANKSYNFSDNITFIKYTTELSC